MTEPTFPAVTEPQPKRFLSPSQSMRSARARARELSTVERQSCQVDRSTIVKLRQSEKCAGCVRASSRVRQVARIRSCDARRDRQLSERWRWRQLMLAEKRALTECRSLVGRRATKHQLLSIDRRRHGWSTVAPASISSWTRAACGGAAAAIPAVWMTASLAPRCMVCDPRR